MRENASRPKKIAAARSNGHRPNLHTVVEPPDEFFDALIAWREAEEPSTDEDAPTSWARVDLKDALDGKSTAAPPSVLRREDGLCMFYANALNGLYGEPESGKSWIVKAAISEQLRASNHVLVLDFETTEAEYVAGLKAMGMTDEVLLQRFHYHRPEEPLRNATELEMAVLLGRDYSLAVIEGVSDSLSAFGLKLDHDGVAQWTRVLVRPLQRTGAAVVMTDHVSKDSEGRGRWAIGPQHKMASIRGAAYYIDKVRKPLARGCHGVVAIRVSKDVAGYVRAESGPFRVGDRTQPFADFHLISSGEDGSTIDVLLERYQDEQAAATSTESVAPAEEPKFHLAMQEACAFVKANPACSKDRIKASIKGIGDTLKRVAIETLEAEGYIDDVHPGAQHRYEWRKDYAPAVKDAV